MRVIFLTLLLTTLIFSSLAFCQIYRWVNENGTVSYSDTPPAGTGSVTKIDATQKYDSISVPNSKTNGKKSNIITQDNTVNFSNKNKVDLYVTSWCPYCKKAIKFFESKNIYVNIYDIEKDRAAYKRKEELDYKKGVPFAVINGNNVHGYNENIYKQYLR